MSPSMVMPSWPPWVVITRCAVVASVSPLRTWSTNAVGSTVSPADGASEAGADESEADDEAEELVGSDGLSVAVESSELQAVRPPRASSTALEAATRRTARVLMV